MIKQSVLRERLDYVNGLLIWLPTGVRKWDTRYAGKVAGSVSGNGRWQIGLTVNGRRITTHRSRFVWAWHTGEWPPELDHKDRNALNDRFENLRTCTRTQNSQNRIRKNSTGLPRGVQPCGDKFKATIQLYGVKTHLGVFDTPNCASFKYEQTRRDYFGEFA